MLITYVDNANYVYTYVNINYFNNNNNELMPIIYDIVIV